jgi:hypothetical protein
MHKTLSLDQSIMRRAVAAAAMVLLVGAGIQGSAWGAESDSALEIQTQYTPPSFVGHPIDTSRGPAFVTGHSGLDTLTLPGNGAPSFLMNNGNGSATVLTPGGAPQTVFTPR